MARYLEMPRLMLPQILGRTIEVVLLTEPNLYIAWMICYALRNDFRPTMCKPSFFFKPTNEICQPPRIAF
jgi:hypothetical protein